VLVLLSGSPAAADPPAPTDFRSEVTAVVPESDVIEASIVGGDGFLLLEVDEGHAVEVPGYSGEPYLRFAADGTVEENEASAAAYLNQSRDRSGTGQDFDPDAEPRWRTVATDGRWAWHDHRIHHMGGQVDPAARTAEGRAWEVPIVVDGEEVTIEGRYRLLDAPSPIPWLLGVAVVAGLIVLLATRAPAVTVAGAAVFVGGLGALVAGVAQRSASPPGAPTSALVVVLPAVAIVGGTLAVLQRGRVVRAVGALAGAAAVGGWAVVRLGVLWHAEVPTDLAPVTERALTSLALGTAIGAAVVVVRSGALAPPPLDRDEGASRDPSAPADVASTPTDGSDAGPEPTSPG
jgi:hypothetical protein